MDVLRFLLVALIAVSILHTLSAGLCTRRFFNRKEPSVPPPHADLPPVSIVKPVATLEEGSFENFSSFCEQDYPHYELIFAFPPTNRDMIPLIRALKERYPEREIRWVEVPQEKGPNYKVGNLMGGAEEAGSEILCFSDSDIRVGPRYLEQVMTEFLKEGVGLVTCLYKNVRIKNTFSALRALTIQTDFIPNVLLDRKLEGVSYGFGATLCTSRKILEGFGGLSVLLHYLADDYQMGRQIHRMGYRVGIPPLLLEQVSSEKSFRDFLRHGIRVVVTHKVCRPWGHRLSVVTHGVFLSLVLLFLQKFSLPSVLLMASVCGVRISTHLYLNQVFMGNRELRRYTWLIPLNDLWNAFLWILSLFIHKVRWKGRRFRITEGGVMVEMAPKVENVL
jgi:ceramide glucosyltransferase